MKYNYYLLLSCLLLATSCLKRNISDMNLYGNTFIKVSDEVFNAPSDWKHYVLGNGEFEIMLPPYMQDNSKPHLEGATNQTYLFNYLNTKELYESHYGRVAIDFIKDNFNLATDYISFKEQNDFWRPIVLQALKGGEIDDGIEVPDGKLLNGPICKELRSNAPICIYNACYRRGGHIKEEGPVSVNMFLLMNKKEAAMIAVSYHDKDSILFKDLFNVVKI